MASDKIKYEYPDPLTAQTQQDHPYYLAPPALPSREDHRNPTSPGRSRHKHSPSSHIQSERLRLIRQPPTFPRLSNNSHTSPYKYQREYAVASSRHGSQPTIRPPQYITLTKRTIPWPSNIARKTTPQMGRRLVTVGLTSKPAVLPNWPRSLRRQETSEHIRKRVKIRHTVSEQTGQQRKEFQRLKRLLRKYESIIMRL